MPEQSIYKDIAKRTDGNIYIGVVGPVRTGKSTFIKRFMESLVIPAIADESARVRARDELPQSAGGKTVMTTEPKFIPDEAIEVTLGDAGQNATMRVRMIDCVGYMVDGAIGNIENDEVRMVHTPWSDAPMPFDEAAEFGTKKVIDEHATIGVLVTTDGSFGELSREHYLEAEKRVAKALADAKKPFVIVLNSADPASREAEALGLWMEETYHAPVALVSCMDMDGEDIHHIMALILNEFPVKEIGISTPIWLRSLPRTHRLSASVCESVKAVAQNANKLGNVAEVFSALNENDAIDGVTLCSLDAGIGRVTLEMKMREGLFYEIIREETGLDIHDDAELLRELCALSEMKREYEHLKPALDDVKARGYGIVMPETDELTLGEPEIVKQSAGYGVRLRATAPSIHMIRANIEAEVSPIVGTEQQSEEMVKFLLHEFEEDPSRLWETNMFGKSLHALISEGLQGKLLHMPDDARQKIGETVARIINEGSGGLICILL